MARVVAISLAALLAAAVAVRATRPTPPPPARATPPAAAEPIHPPPAPAPEPMPTAAAPAPAYAEPVLRADEIRTLLDARFPDETILAFARVSGRPFRASPEEVDALRQAGMSDALLGALAGAPPPTTSEPPPVVVAPVITVYAPVTVTTVVEAPPPPPEPEPFISTVVLVPACPPPLGAPLPPIYQKPPFFKMHEYMPTKRSPTAEDVARQEKARASRIYR